MALAVGALVLATVNLAFADDEPDAAGGVKLTESQQLAADKLMEMANFMAGLEAFSVHSRAGFDVMQEDGQKIEFLENRDITMERPDRLVIREESAKDLAHLLLFDGEVITISDGATGVYAQVPQPGSIDDTIVYFLRELKSRVRMIEYVEESGALPVPTHHVAVRTDTLDFQVWIADGKQPFPMRVVLTYPEQGAPQYWTEYSEWNLKPSIRKSTFAFKPATDAQKNRVGRAT